MKPSNWELEDHKFFSTKSIYLGRRDLTPFMILEIHFLEFKLINWMDFTESQKILTEIKEQMKAFKEHLVKSRLGFLRKTQ